MKIEIYKEDISRLLEIMARLRDPHRGCVWDLEQTFASIAPYTLEEAYEVADAIARGDLGDLCDELGDLLLQVVYHARMAEEAGAFDFGDVVAAICTKMVRRHPHVFGDDHVGTAEAQTEAWEALKAKERGGEGTSVVDGVPIALPALTRGAKLAGRAARVGFDWPDAAAVRRKLDEELVELDEARAAGNPESIAAEVGDTFPYPNQPLSASGVGPRNAARGKPTHGSRRGFAASRTGFKRSKGLGIVSIQRRWSACGSSPNRWSRAVDF